MQCAVNAQVPDPDCNQTTRVVIGLLDKARLLDKGHHVYMCHTLAEVCLASGEGGHTRHLIL